MKRRRLSVFPAEPLHRLGVLIAFVLIVASTEFISTHPFLTAGLVFIFSLGYLFASVTTRRSYCAQQNLSYKYVLEWMGHSSGAILDMYFTMNDRHALAAMNSMSFKSGKTESRAVSG